MILAGTKTEMKNVAALSFADVELVDFCPHLKSSPLLAGADPTPFNVYAVAESNGPVGAKTLNDPVTPSYGTRERLAERTFLP